MSATLANIEELGQVVGEAAAVMLFAHPEQCPKNLRDLRRGGGRVVITFDGRGNAVATVGA